MGITTRGPHYDYMRDRWDRAYALRGGTQTMRDAGALYLPQFPKESDDNWMRRLRMATLTNFWKRASESMIANMFREPIQYETELPDEIVENIDRRGADLTQFAIDVATGIIEDGVVMAVVDYPNAPSSLSVEDERRLGVRHYAYLIRPRSVIAAHETQVDGRRQLVYSSWYERKVSISGYDCFEDRMVRMIKRNEAGEIIWETHRVLAAADGSVNEGDDASTELYETGEIDFDRVPIVIGYANSVSRDGCFACRPLLDDIAFKNIEHWQSSSDQRNILNVSRFPILVEKTANPDDALLFNAIGPHLKATIGQEDDLKYITAPTDGVEAGWRDLDNILREAQIMALELKLDQSPTATGRVLDRIEGMSPLQRVATEVEHVVNGVLQIIADWRGQGEDPGRIHINKDFGPTVADSVRVMALKDAVVLGAITMETYLKELQAIDFISQDIDPAQEVMNAKAQDDVLADAPPTLPQAFRSTQDA